MNPLAMVLAQDSGPEVTLTAQGALLMFLCVGLVLGLNVFCMLRILRPQKPPQEQPAPLDIDEPQGHDVK